MIELHGERGKIGQASLRSGTITATPDTVQVIADHMLKKHGTPEKAFKAMSAINNGYVWAVAAKPGTANASLAAEVQKVYRKLIAKGMKSGQALAMAKRAAAMHAKATAKAA